MRRAALVIVALLLGGAADPRPPAPVVGAIYPTTGAGAAAREAIEVALDIVNGTHAAIPVLMGAGGGLDRMGGAKLAVAYADDGADEPAAATAAAERLVADGASLLVGGLSDASAAAISRVAEAHGLPFLALHSAQPNDADLTWFFRLGRTPARDARSVLQQLGAVAGAHGRTLQTVVLLFEDAPAGQARAAPVRAAAAAAGIKAVDVPLPPGAVSAEAAQAIAAAKPDALLSLGLDPATLLPLGAAAPLVLFQTAGAAGTDGVFRTASFTATPLPARPGVSPVAAAFQSRTGRPLDADAAREITGMLLLADVIDRAGTTKPIDLRTALMATDTPGSEVLMLWEGIRFDDSGQNVRATPALQQAQGGTFQTVMPSEIAAATPTWPTPP